jgi:hypothetical protein
MKTLGLKQISGKLVLSYFKFLRLVIAKQVGVIH